MQCTLDSCHTLLAIHKREAHLDSVFDLFCGVILHVLICTEGAATELLYAQLALAGSAMSCRQML